METRKGFLTPDQEKILDELIKFNNKVAERLDGPAIQLMDNQGLERIKSDLEEKYPGSVELVYQVVDGIFEALKEISQGDEVS
jgi:hypothetical protein